MDIVGGGVIREKNGNPVVLQEAPYAGDFVFVPHHERTSISFARGPEYFDKDITPNPDGSQSTHHADLERFAGLRRGFRVALVARDFSCLVTDARYEKCTPCHIIPPSRPDVYRDILSIITYPPPMFDVSAGLLLRDDIHHAFNRLELSLYFHDGIYYLHCFILGLEAARELHGKVLRFDHFRGKEPDKPDPRFLRWHYNQCVKARIRGFAVGMEPPSTSSAI